MRSLKMREKDQAAMDYLSTLIWALLIIGVALFGLYIYGVFSVGATGPRAFPGACQVAKGTPSSMSSLYGICDNELPKWVGVFGTNGTWTFDCAIHGTCVGIPPVFTYKPLCNVTITGWSYDSGMGPLGGPAGVTYDTWYSGSGAVPDVPALGGVFSIFNNTDPSLGAMDVEYNNSIIRFEVRNNTDRNQIFFSGSYDNKWMQTAVELDNGVAYAFIDGKQVGSKSPHRVGCVHLTNGTIGSWDRNFHGFIANVQIYNSSLSENEINVLYYEGIGGVPIDLANLVGWYPLNLYPYDYSGNGHNGYIYNVTEYGSWSSNYTPP